MKIAKLLRDIISFFILLILNINLANCQQTKETSHVSSKDKPKIKMEEITHYEISNFKQRRDYRFGEDVIKQYDTNGNPIKESWIIRNTEAEKDTAIVISLYHYQNNYLKKIENFSAIQGGAKNSEIEYEYDSSNKIKKETHKRIKDGKEILNEYCLHINYFYEKNKEIQAIYRYNEKNKTFTFSHRQENSSGRNNKKIGELYFDEDNKVYREKRFTYNSNNQLITEFTNDLANSFNLYYEYKYDQNGNVIQETYMKNNNGANKQITQTTYKYDYYNNWIERKEVSNYTASQLGKRRAEPNRPLS